MIENWMKQSNNFWGFSALVLLCLSGNSARAAEVSIGTRGSSNTPVISIVGEIVEGDDEKFRVMARKAPTALVRLDSPGGLIDPAMEIGRIIWYNDMGTFVEDAECASACGLIWLAGQPRALSKNGKVGFHSVYHTASKTSVVQSSSGNALVGAYLNSLKLNAKVVEYVTSTSPSDMRWLTEVDAQAIGLDAFFVDREYRAGDDYEAGFSRISAMRGKADDRAVELYYSAARLGFAGAQNNLGDLYENGNGVQKDLISAAFWYSRSAERGEPTAYLSLASLLSASADPNVLVEALMFAILAGERLPDGRNKASALELTRGLTDRLPPSLRQLAMDLAKKWVPLYQETRLLGDAPEH